MQQRLFHFSEDLAITIFEPQPVVTPPVRPPGREWLNGPLVWAIDEWHSPMYLFPRECPRILLWKLPGTTGADLARWWGERDGSVRMVAYVEHAWWERIESATVYRYVLPADGFEDLDDAGMYVSRDVARPFDVAAVCDLPAALRESNVELCPLDSLVGLKPVWESTLHASGIRLRNANGWV